MGTQPRVETSIHGKRCENDYRQKKKCIICLDAGGKGEGKKESLKQESRSQSWAGVKTTAPMLGVGGAHL